MLQTIRDRAQGWIAWVIVILISIPFALWGIQSYLGVGAEPVAATVEGIEITERDLDMRYQSTRMRLREELGAAYRPGLFDEKTMRAQVLDAMIRENLLLKFSHELGLRASDAELRTAILTNPAFQSGGRFDNATYERMLQLQGMSPTQYEDGLRQRLVGTQLERTVLASAVVSERELDEAIRLEEQRREIAYIRVPKAEFVSDQPFSEDEIRAYYEENSERFRLPERVKVRYIVLDTEAVGAEQEPDEARLRAMYESELERFSTPERRRVRHILISVPGDAGSAAENAAKARIGELRARILGGEDFASVAKEASEDPGSAAQGGALGMIEKGLMDPAFDQAAFALEEGELSEPVRSQFGYHLIEVTEIDPAKVKPFEAVRGELLEEARAQGVEGQFFDWAERLANLAYESPDSLEPAAEALGLEIATSGWIDRTGGEGLFASRKLVAAAFSEDVLREGMNSDLIEPEPGVLKAVVLRVAEHEESSIKPLEEVREEVVSALRDRRAGEAALAEAEEIARRLGQGEAVGAVAGTYELTEPGLVGRDAAEVPAGVRAVAFAMPRPADGAPSLDTTALAGGDAAVVLVSRVVDGSREDLSAQEIQALRDRLERNFANAYFEAVVADLESRAEIERKLAEEDESQ